MNKTELIEIIRGVVKEEVNASMSQLLAEVFVSKLNEGSSAAKPVAARKPQPVAPPPAPVAPLKKYSSNPILNQILNETKGGVPQDQDAPSIMDTVQAMTPEQLNENSAVADVAKALTKDYRSLLKAVDSKARAKR